MILFSNNFFKGLKYKLVTRFNYKNTKTLPHFSKVVLNIGHTNIDKQDLLSGMLFLQLVSNKKAYFTKSKISNLFLKIKKGNPTGSKVILKGFYSLNFVINTFQKILPNIKNFKGLKNTSTNSFFTYNIRRISVFEESGFNYSFFKKLTNMNIKLIAHKNSKKEFDFFLEFLKTPFKP